mgnify:CR=1 FL=1
MLERSFVLGIVGDHPSDPMVLYWYRPGRPVRFTYLTTFDAVPTILEEAICTAVTTALRKAGEQLDPPKILQDGSLLKKVLAQPESQQAEKQLIPAVLFPELRLAGCTTEQI